MTVELKPFHENVQECTDHCFDCGYNTNTHWLRGCPGRRLTAEEEAEVKEDDAKRSWLLYGYENEMMLLHALESKVHAKRAVIDGNVAKWGKPVYRDIIDMK